MRRREYHLLGLMLCAPLSASAQTPGNGPWHLAAQRSGSWLPGVDSVLQAAGASRTLRAVPLLRSGGDPGRRTPDGRAGLWALLPSDAHAIQLRITPWIDERLDPIRSTHAVIHHHMSMGDDTLKVRALPTPGWPAPSRSESIRLVTARFLSLEDIARTRSLSLSALRSMNRHLVRDHTAPGDVSVLYLPRGQSVDLRDIPDVRLVGVVALHHGSLRDLAVATRVPLPLLLEWNPGHASYRRGDIIRVPSTLRHATARARPLPLATTR